jgi:MoxR-like ATPase
MQDARLVVKDIAANLGKVILGKDDKIELMILALLAGGHILLEDIPGVGKTTLAKALAKSIEGSFKRIQFTPDLLPTDILGSSIYHAQDSTFHFRKGPIFANIVLADEINRASPRTQSALLEAMSEAQVTIEGTTYPLEPPFLVIATQNPIEYRGTYPLPEAQLDRFWVQLSLGYPPLEQEKGMLYAQKVSHPIDSLQPVVNLSQIQELQRMVSEIEVESSIADYLLAIVENTRRHPSIQVGVSPRGSLMLFRAIRANALLKGRTYVIPEDVKKLLIPVLSHRIVLETQAKYSGIRKEDLMKEILEKVPVPR